MAFGNTTTVYDNESEESPTDFVEYKTGTWLWLYAAPCLLIIGVAGEENTHVYFTKMAEREKLPSCCMATNKMFRIKFEKIVNVVTKHCRFKYTQARSKHGSGANYYYFDFY